MSELLTQSSVSACPDDQRLARFLTEGDDLTAAHVDECAACQHRLDRLFDDSLAAGPPLTSELRLSPEAAAAATVSGADEAFLQTLISNLHEGVDRLVAEWKSPRTDTLRFPGPADERAPLGRLDRFEMLELVGSGGTGHLYRAWDPRLQRFVAVKVLRGEYAAVTSSRDRFLREAHAAARIQHASMAVVYEVHSPDDFPPWIVQEFVEGQSLQAYLRSRGPLPADHAAQIVTQILAALQAAHQCGIVHRDVKPSNVLLTSSGDVKLVDFGLARLTTAESDLTADGVIAGTPAYMSPEQALAPADVDHRADVYSAGVVLYELLTGDRPFRGSVRRVLHDVVHSEPVSPRRLDDRIPRDLETVCLKALQKPPTARYPSAVAFGEDLTRFLQQQPILARRVSLLERGLRWSQRNPAIAGLSAVLTVSLLAGVVIWASFVLRVTNANARLGRTVESLKQSNSQLRDARKAAQRNADIADQQTRVAFDMVSALIFEVQQELSQQPGTADLRRRLLTQALQGLQRVQVSANPEATVAVAVGEIMALNRIGDALQGAASTAQTPGPTQDHPSAQEAFAQYENALRKAEQLLATTEPQDVPLVCSAVVVSAWNLGDACRRSGLSERAEQIYTTGLTTARTWRDAAPQSQDAAYNIAVGWQRLADVAGDAGLPDVQQQHLRHSARVLEQLRQQNDSAAVSWALVQVRFDAWQLSPGKDRTADGIRAVYDLLPADDSLSVADDSLPVAEDSLSVAEDRLPVSEDRRRLRAAVCVALASYQEDSRRAEKLSLQAIENLQATSKTFTEQLAVARASLAQAMLAQDRSAEAGELFRQWGGADTRWKPSAQVGYLLTRMATEAAQGNDEAEISSQAIADVFERINNSDDPDLLDDRVLQQQRQKWMALRDWWKLSSGDGR